MDPKRRKQLIITAAVVAGLYYFPAIMNTARHTLIVRNEDYRQMEKPSPAKPVEPAGTLPAPPGATVIRAGGRRYACRPEIRGPARQIHGRSHPEDP